MAWTKDGNIKGPPGSAAGDPLYKTAVPASVTNTTVATAVATIPIPAGALGTDQAIDVTVCGTYQNTSGSTPTLTLTLALGGTTMYADVSAAKTSGAALHPFQLTARLYAAGSASAQGITGTFFMGTLVSATTGIGDLATVPAAATGIFTPFAGSAAVDSTAVQNLVLTAKHSVANAATTLMITHVEAHVAGQGPKGDTGAAPWTQITQAAYDALSPPDANTLYVIVG